MVSLLPAPRVGAAPEGRVETVEPLAPVVYHDARLREMVEELQRESPTAASMLLTVRRLGFPIAFGTFADLAEEMQQEYSAWTRSSRSAAGYMAPVVRQVKEFSEELETVKINVAVNLSMLDELFLSAPAALPQADVDWEEIRRLETLSVLAHELVHAYGLALSGGDPRQGCHDPEEGELPEASCVMVGENIVRGEIGAPIDWDYGFPSAVSLAQRYSDAAARRAKLLEIAGFRAAFGFGAPLRLPPRLAIDG
jgi:hypothetical protein